jgi:hypothetical protein
VRRIRFSWVGCEVGCGLGLRGLGLCGWVYFALGFWILCFDRECGFDGFCWSGFLWRGWFELCDWCDEAVASAGEGLDEAWVVGGVAEGFADFVDGGAEGVVEVDGGVFAPEAELEVFAGDNFAGLLQKSREDFEGLALDLDAPARFPQFFCLQVGFEEAEADSCGGCGHFLVLSSQLSVFSWCWLISKSISTDDDDSVGQRVFYALS